MAYTKQNFSNGQVLNANHLNQMETGIVAATKDTYVETDGVGSIVNPVASGNGYWTKWNSRLSFGMNTSSAPVPMVVNGQLYADGTIISHNTGDQKYNRWGFHVFEGYSVNNYARITMLLDKHSSETNGKPSAEFYYYTGADHYASSYGNMKIGSDVELHSFCFDRDKMTAYGEVDMKMPLTLARISLSNDLITTHSTVVAADAAYEPEDYPEQNNRCLKFIALKNAVNGAMFYDTDRNQVVCKVNGKWCDIPVVEIEDSSYDILEGGSSDSGGTALNITWESGVIGGYGDNAANSARLRTTSYLPSNVTTVTANSGYEFALIVLNSNGTASNNCYYNPNTGTQSSSPTWVTNMDVGSVSVSGYPNKKLIARRTDQGNINVSEGVNIVVNSGSNSGGSSSTATTSISWEQGMLTAEGWEIDHAERIRTSECLPSGIKKITANTGYDVLAVFLATETPGDGGSYFNPTTKQLTTETVWVSEIDLTGVSFTQYPKIRLFVKKTNSAAITPSEGANIILTYDVIWDSGVIGAYGDEVENTGRIRTRDYLPSSAKKITASTGWDFCVLFLDSTGVSNGAPYYNPTTGTLSGDVVWYTTVDLTNVSFDGLPNIRLIAKRQDFYQVAGVDGKYIVITSG